MPRTRKDKLRKCQCGARGRVIGVKHTGYNSYYIVECLGCKRQYITTSQAAMRQWEGSSARAGE